jgi:hypothetical protein
LHQRLSLGGHVAIPAFTNVHEAQAVFPKAKTFVKNVIGKIFHIDGDSGGVDGCTTC